MSCSCLCTLVYPRHGCTGGCITTNCVSLQVPLDDGWRYVDALKTRGVDSRVLVFPEDSHALDKPQTEVEQWLNIAWWLKLHL